MNLLERACLKIKHKTIKCLIGYISLNKSRYLNNNIADISDGYSLVLEFGFGRRLYGYIYRDAVNSLVLYNGSPKEDAVLGFDAVGNSLSVVQLQARKGIGKENLPYKWEKILLEAGIDYARETGFKQIHVQRAKNNKWFCKHESNSNESERNKRLEIRYDVTAKRRGFSLDEKLDAWVLNLK